MQKSKRKKNLKCSIHARNLSTSHDGSVHPEGFSSIPLQFVPFYNGSIENFSSNHALQNYLNFTGHPQPFAFDPRFFNNPEYASPVSSVSQTCSECLVNRRKKHGDHLTRPESESTIGDNDVLEFYKKGEETIHTPSEGSLSICDAPQSKKDRDASMTEFMMEIFGSNSHITQQFKNNVRCRYDERFRSLRKDTENNDDEVKMISPNNKNEEETVKLENTVSIVESEGKMNTIAVESKNVPVQPDLVQIQNCVTQKETALEIKEIAKRVSILSKQVQFLFICFFLSGFVIMSALLHYSICSNNCLKSV